MFWQWDDKIFFYKWSKYKIVICALKMILQNSFCKWSLNKIVLCAGVCLDPKIRVEALSAGESPATTVVLDIYDVSVTLSIFQGCLCVLFAFLFLYTTVIAFLKQGYAIIIKLIPCAFHWLRFIAGHGRCFPGGTHVVTTHLWAVIPCAYIWLDIS